MEGDQVSLLEKYKPKKLEDFLLPLTEMEKLKRLYDLKPGVYILYSPPGTGKSTFCELLMEKAKHQLGQRNILKLNASLNNTVEVIKDVVYPFVSKKVRRLVIFEEADKLTKNLPTGKGAQEALKDLTSTYRQIWVFVTNHLSEIIEPLRDRAYLINFTPDKNKYTKFAIKVALQEKLKYDVTDIYRLVEQHYPSIRSLLLKFENREIASRLDQDVKKLLNKELHPLTFVRRYPNIDYSSVVLKLINDNDIDDETKFKLLLLVGCIKKVDDKLAPYLFSYVLYYIRDNDERFIDIIDYVLKAMFTMDATAFKYYSKLNELRSKKK